MNKVKQNGAEVPKIIVFCNTLREIAVVVNHLFNGGDYAYHPTTSGKIGGFVDWNFSFCLVASTEGDAITIIKCQWIKKDCCSEYLAWESTFLTYDML